MHRCGRAGADFESDGASRSDGDLDRLTLIGESLVSDEPRFVD